MRLWERRKVRNNMRKILHLLYSKELLYHWRKIYAIKCVNIVPEWRELLCNWRRKLRKNMHKYGTWVERAALPPTQKTPRLSPQLARIAFITFQAFMQLYLFRPLNFKTALKTLFFYKNYTVSIQTHFSLKTGFTTFFKIILESKKSNLIQHKNSSIKTLNLCSLSCSPSKPHQIKQKNIYHNMNR